MNTTGRRITAQVSEKAPVHHAAFTDSQHRTPDGVSSSIADTWRTRANNKPLIIKRTGA
jgi:hypothetical protein